MMKIGDMVKFSAIMAGLGDALGLVIGFSEIGNTRRAVEVQWFDKSVTRAREPITTELTEFLEVVSASR
jgi:hypothetical protein